MEKTIPLVKPYIAPKEEMMPAIEKILYSGYIAIGEAVLDFEKVFGSYINNDNVVALNSGTGALHIALELIGVQSGDEVISTPMTSEATNTTISITGAKVVWADVDPKTGLLDPDSVESKISEKTKAIMLVHYAGMVCDMDRFNLISQKYNIPIIEDSAHALGAKYGNKLLGSNSPYTCFSFQAIKHMTTVDGGMICLRDDKQLDVTKRMSWFGLSKEVSRLENDIKRAGFKYRMNNVNATIGSVQMMHISEIIDAHIDNGRYYDKELRGIPGLELVTYYKNTSPSYWIYTMRVENRDNFCKMMEEKGIAATPFHHRNDTHSFLDYAKCQLPNMDKWYSSFVHIPCGWWLSKEDREYIVETIKRGW